MAKTRQQIIDEFTERYNERPYAIMVCPFCSRIDVTPAHFDKCDPEAEEMRREAQEYYD